MNNYEKLLNMKFKDLYDLYLKKVIRKGRSKEELDEIIDWLFSYSVEDINKMIAQEVSSEFFFTSYKNLNENSHLIKGVICGIRVEEIEDPLIRHIRYLDKLIDELSKGKSIDKIKRVPKS